MAAHSLAKDILQKIIFEKIPFSLALKQAFKKGDISKEDRSVISAVVGCALRHFIVMERLIKDAYPDIEGDGFTALLIAFSTCSTLTSFPKGIVSARLQASPLLSDEK